MKKVIKSVLATGFFLSLILGIISMLFRTDFGVTRWMPVQYQWILILVILAWWVGLFAWLIKEQLDK